MAFNPFGYFRKHQKVFLVILTIGAMVTFVFSFGPGDLFQTLLGYIGAGRSTGPEVTELYGKSLTEGNIEKTRVSREVANSLLLTAVNQPLQRAFDLASKRNEDLSEKAPNRARFAALFQSIAQRQGQLLRMQLQGTDPTQVRLFINASALQDLATLAQIHADDPELFQKEDQRQIWNALTARASLRAWSGTGGFLLGGTPFLDDLLDFRVWLHQADELGIQLTEADVRALINRLAGGQDVFDGQPFEQSDFVRNALSNSSARSRYQPNSPGELLQAVTDEFRAALAQEALLGRGPGIWAYRGEAGIDRSPAVPTPAAFLAYFRKVRTTVKVALLPVPADDPAILSQVQGTPSEEELRFLYDKYKEVEPNPASREPGFKEPRKILVQYVQASAKDPYYQKLAQEVARTAPAALVFTAPLHGGPQAGGAAGLVATLTWPLAHDPVRQRYEEYRARAHVDAEDGLGLGFDPGDRAAEARYTVGQMLAAGPRGTPLGVASAAVATRSLYAKATARVVSMAWLVGWGPPLAGLGEVTPVAQQVQSYARAKSWLEEEYASRRAGTFLSKNLNDLDERIKKQKNHPAKVEEEIQKAVTEYHLHLEKMGSPRDFYAITEAPAIKAMAEAVDEKPDQTLAQQLFNGRGPYDPARLSSPLGQTQVLYWRVEDLSARVRPFGEVRDQVVEAWKLQRARLIAQKKAREIAEAAKKKTWVTDASQREDDVKAFLNEKAPRGKKAFVLDNVARIVRPPQPIAARQNYQRYQVPKDQEENLRYADGPDLAEKLTELDKPGAVTVVADVPARTFYVAVLLARDAKTLDDFYRVFEHAKDNDPMWEGFLGKRRQDYDIAVLLRLRKEAGQVDEDGRFVVPQAVRERSNAAARE